MAILLEHLGVLETEQFISAILKEPFDCTEWSREHFADVDLREFNRQAIYDKANPVRG